MPQTPEAQDFLSRISALPKDTPVNLDDALKPSIEDETELRRLFATDPGNARLKDIHVGLVDVFDAPQDIRTTRTRAVRDEFDLNEKYIMPLSETRRRKEGTPAMAVDLDEFKSNWAIFTESSLSLLDWNNVVAAGGSILACLSPVPEAAKDSKRALRKHFHTDAFPTSDVDLFLYGLTPEQAEAKIMSIYKSVRDTIPWDCTCVRTKHSISIHSQYPYRSIQIVLRLYSSPAEILAGFDVDAPCCAYDGTRVWANPRAIVAMMRQCNTVDVTRRSPSYEVRLSKYSFRDFEIQVPTLKRGDIDPTIFERSIARVPGLARLIVLERLYSPESRAEYLNARRSLRGRPTSYDFRQRRNRYKGDLKADLAEDSIMMNSYDVVSLHIPYGPGWHARRINKLVYQTDLGMNSPFNPKNKGRRIHRHPAFFGSMDECMEDCCEFCPEAKDEEEKQIQETEDEVFIRGRIQFIQDDPGRQSLSGSFNPIDDGEWAEQAYMGESEKLCQAISSFDRVSVLRMINEDKINAERRDHVGRTPLQVAIICRASDIACDLIDAGARMTNRMADGKTALHLVAQLDLPQVAKKLLERSATNKEKAEEAEAEKKANEEKQKLEVAEKKADEDDPMDEDKDEGEEEEEKDSSDDDWSSGEEGDEKATEEAKDKEGDIPEDEEDAPDVFDVELPDWDFGLTPLGYAVIFGSVDVVEVLLVAGGADPEQVVKAREHLHPLTLTILTEDDKRASRIVEHLLKAGAKSSTADSTLFTIFHRFVCAQKTHLVSTVLHTDPNAKTLVNFPSATYNRVIFPVVSAIQSGNYAMLALLLAHGAKLVLKNADLQSARDALERQDAINPDELKVLRSPVETALASHDQVVHLLVAAGAEVSLPAFEAYNHSYESDRASLNDLVLAEIDKIDKKIKDEFSDKAEPESEPGPEPMAETPPASSGWEAYYLEHVRKLEEKPKKDDAEEEERRKQAAEAKEKEKRMYLGLKEYHQEVKALFAKNNAKSWNELYPSKPTLKLVSPTPFTSYRSPDEIPQKQNPYQRWPFNWQSVPVAEEQVPLYDELYEACWNGDNEKIQELCLPKDSPKPGQQALQIVASTKKGDYSPFFVAIHRRHWTTARLILTIASAQEVKTEKQEALEKFSLANLKLNKDDSDDEEEDSDDGSMDIEEEEVNFIDVAQRKPAARYNIGPDKLLYFTTMRETDPTTTYNPVNLAIADGDFEAFVQLAELCKALPKPVPWVLFVSLPVLLEFDRVEILDEYIRRTGNGIHIPEKRVIEEASGAPERPKGKEYWGLNVHGKKRKDLATKGDPNARGQVDLVGSIPLVWQAIQNFAPEILDYLASDRPLAAYRYYFSTNTSDKRAKHISDLAETLPEKLGWCVNGVNETPLAAAVKADRLDAAKHLFTLRPKLMKEYLHYKINFSGYNLFLRAVYGNCSIAFIDYLLENGVSATHFDPRGWNVLHIAVDGNRKILLKYLLEKLPKEDVDAMMVQQSKPYHNTPLHIAAMKGNIDIVKMLVTLKTPAFLLRDINGFTPLHAAVKLGFSGLTTILGEAGPAEALYMENAVGELPVETAILRNLIGCYRDGIEGILNNPRTLRISSGYIATETPFPLDQMETRIPKLKRIVEELVNEGKISKGIKLHKALVSFVDKMEAKLAEVRIKDVAIKVAQVPPEEPETQENERHNRDCSNAITTLEAVRELMRQKPPMHRLLIHIADVHKSVQANLPEPPQDQPKTTANDDDDDLEEVEKEDENTHLSRRWLSDYVNTSDTTFV